MKALTLFTLILVAALPAMGQESTTSVWAVPEAVSEEVLTIPHFISLWDEWADSCWSDSVKVWGVEPYEGYKHLFTPCGSRDTLYFGCLWQHRDPNDLQGFMEFIRRRTR